VAHIVSGQPETTKGGILLGNPKVVFFPHCGGTKKNKWLEKGFGCVVFLYQKGGVGGSTQVLTNLFFTPPRSGKVELGKDTSSELKPQKNRTGGGGKDRKRGNLFKKKK